MEDKLKTLTNHLGMENKFIIHLWRLLENECYNTLDWYLANSKMF